MRYISIKGRSPHLSNDVTPQAVHEVRYFSCKKNVYIWDRVSAVFYKTEGLDRNITLSGLHGCKEGLTAAEKEQRASLYGENKIPVEVSTVRVVP